MTIIRQKRIRYIEFLPLLIILPFLPSLIESLILSRGNIESYYQLYYFIGYEYGFGGRKLLGTLFSHFLPEYVSHRQLLPIIWGINFIFLFLFISLVTKGIKKAHEYGIGITLISIYALWFVSPFSISSYMSQGVNIMFPEIWSMTLALAFIIIFKYFRNKWWYYISTLIICILGCLIHHVFCCLFFPLILSIIIEDIFSDFINKKSTRKKISLYGLICLVLTLLFIMIWMFSEMNTNIDDLYNTICKRTAPNVCIHDKEAINQLYYLSNINNCRNQSHLFHYRFIDLLLTLLLTLPLITFLLAPWVIAYKKALTNNDRLKYFFVGIAPTVVHAPIYFFAVDYGRWEYAWFFNYICLVIVFVWIGDKGIINALKHLKEIITQFRYSFICLLMYLAILPSSNAWEIPLIHKITNYLIFLFN